MEHTNPKSEIAEWIRLYTKPLYQWALYKTSDKMLAEDLVQDTFLVVVENLHQFDRKSQPKTWLMGILKNKIANHYREIVKSTVHKPLSIETYEPFFTEKEGWKPHALPQLWAIDTSEHLLDNQQFNNILQACLQNLSAPFRACLQLKFLEEKKAKEICQELNISPTNYWQHLHRAKLQLRHCTENHWFKKV
jgi:RNA polymerase sigma-70 factor (TIGR02943 family)